MDSENSDIESNTSEEEDDKKSEEEDNIKSESVFLPYEIKWQIMMFLPLRYYLNCFLVDKSFHSLWKMDEFWKNVMNYQKPRYVKQKKKKKDEKWFDFFLGWVTGWRRYCHELAVRADVGYGGALILRPKNQNNYFENIGMSLYWHEAAQIKKLFDPKCENHYVLGHRRSSEGTFVRFGKKKYYVVKGWSDGWGDKFVFFLAVNTQNKDLWVVGSSTKTTIFIIAFDKTKHQTAGNCCRAIGELADHFDSKGY